MRQDEETDVIPTEASEIPKTPESPDSDRGWLPEQFRDHAAFRNVKNPDDWAEQFIGASSLVGKRVADLTPEEVRRYQLQAGLPATAEEYRLDVEGIAETEWDKEFEAKIRAAAHKAGILPEQLQELVSGYGEYFITQRDASQRIQDERATAAAKEMRSEWGEATEAKLHAVVRGLQVVGGDKAKAELRSLGAVDGEGNIISPTVARMLAAIGEANREPTLHGASQGSLTPGLARSALDAKFADAKFMRNWTNGAEPEHESAVAEMTALLQQSRQPFAR